MTSDLSPPRTQNANLFAAVGYLFVGPVVSILTLFGIAGTLAWVAGWWFIGAAFTTDLAEVAFLWCRNPATLLNRQLHRSEVVSIFITIPVGIAILVIAAIDAGRFHWSNVPWYGYALGYVLFLVSRGLAVSAEAVREGAGQIVDAGPYSVIRHPVTLSMVGSGIGIGFCLGSLIALIPGLLMLLILLIQTQWMDRKLQASSPEYRQFAERVRFRWVPGLW